jgi:hypothetical protein
MKLSPQPAGVLPPLSSKAAPAALLDKGAFAATMQDLMVPPSGPAVSAVMQSPADGLPQITARIRPVTLRQEMHASAGEEHSVPSQISIVLTSIAAVPVLRDEMRYPVTPQPSIQVSSSTEELSELPISMPKVMNPIEETVLQQPLAAPREPRLAADSHASSRAEHKAGAVTRDPANPAIAHSPETLPAATIPAQCPIPVSVPQPDWPEQTFSERNVQPAIHSPHKAGGSRRSVSMSRPVMMAPTTASNSRSELLQVAQEEPPLKKFATVMNSQPPGPTRETTIPGTLPRSNQDNLPGPTVHSKEGHETTALQVDAHASQEDGKTSSAVTKPVLAAEPSIHLALDLSPAQRLPLANTPDPSPAMHRPEVLTETHHAQANAAQVLQRMDTAAPSGAVQLRADARHLDVGVSSGVLGWVEVRATAGSSGRVDAALHVQTNSSAHMLTAQSKEIATYAREHSVELGQLSVGVGTGDSARGHSRSMQDAPGSEDTAPVKRALKTAVSNEPQQPAEKVSFISIRA